MKTKMPWKLNRWSKTTLESRNMTDALVKSDDKHSAVMQSLAVFTRSFSSHILSAVMALIHVTAVCSHSTLNAVHTTHCHDLYWSKNATSDCKDAKSQAKHHKSAKNTTNGNKIWTNRFASKVWFKSLCTHPVGQTVLKCWHKRRITYVDGKRQTKINQYIAISNPISYWVSWTLAFQVSSISSVIHTKKQVSF